MTDYGSYDECECGNWKWWHEKFCHSCTKAKREEEDQLAFEERLEKAIERGLSPNLALLASLLKEANLKPYFHKPGCSMKDCDCHNGL